MKVAYLLKKFPRLSETFVLGEILRQESLGADVVVFSRRTADDEPRHPALSELRAPILLVGGEEGLDPWRELFSDMTVGESTFEQLGDAVRLLQRAGVPRVQKLVSEALWVLRRCRELEIDHIHVHFATESAFVAWMVHQLGGPGFSLTAHAKDIYRSTVRPGTLSQIVGDSQFTVTVCDANVGYLCDILDERAQTRLRRLYNGIDLADFAWSDEPRSKTHVLAVGRLVEKKGFDVLLEAIAILGKRGSRARATILGDGEQREALVAASKRLGIEDRVDLPGAVDQAAVRRAMARAAVFALPCRIGEDGNRDALPTVLLEALAVGLPVVSTRVTGIPEILNGGLCGELIDPNDPGALADSLSELLGAKDERVRLARAGRRHAERHFDGEVAAKTLHGWFEEAIAQRTVA